MAFSRGAISAGLIDASIAQEWPLATGLFNQRQVALCGEDGRLRTGLHEVSTKRIAHERLTKKFETVGAVLRLEAHAIWRGDEYAVRNGVRALGRAPRVDLRISEGSLLRRMPGNGSWIEQNLRAKQRGDARRLGIPLIPADEHSDVSEPGAPDTKAVDAGMPIAALI